MRFAIFPFHLSQSTAPATKKWRPGQKKCCTCYAKSSSQTWRLMLQKQPLSGNQRPDLLTYLIHVSLVLRLPCKMHLCRSSSNIPRLPTLLKLPQNHHIFLTFDKVHNPLRLLRETTSERQKVVRAWCFVHFDFDMCFATTVCIFSTAQLPKVLRHWNVLYILTWECALRHNGAHFFESSTSKSAPALVCFAHFDFQMCFAPLRRALFRELNFQKCSGVGVFCTFWLPNVFRATTARTFSKSQLPKVLQRWGVLFILTSKFASRRNGGQFFISHLPTLASLLFDPPEPSAVRLFYIFVRLHLLSSDSFSCLTFFLLLFSSLLFSSLLFSSLTLSTSVFSSVQVVGSLTSKIPSIIPIFLKTYIIITNI